MTLDLKTDEAVVVEIKGLDGKQSSHYGRVRTVESVPDFSGRYTVECCLANGQTKKVFFYGDGTPYLKGVSVRKPGFLEWMRNDFGESVVKKLQRQDFGGYAYMPE